jgi:hypothetical protein
MPHPVALDGAECGIDHHRDTSKTCRVLHHGPSAGPTGVDTLAGGIGHGDAAEAASSFCVNHSVTSCGAVATVLLIAGFGLSRGVWPRYRIAGPS